MSFRSKSRAGITAAAICVVVAGGFPGVLVAQSPDASLPDTAVPTAARPSEDQQAESAIAAVFSDDPLGQMAALEASTDDAEAPLELFGFADVGYSKPFWSEESLYAGSGLDARPYFHVGNLNVYVAKTLATRWRFLSEFRFTFAPNGAPSASTVNGMVDTSVPDPADVSRPFRYGSIEIERAQIEYELHSLFAVAAGLWLTPYGIWNIDHGSPTVIAIRRPYIVGEQLFPERQAGIQLRGSWHTGSYRLQYHLTASNGRGSPGRANLITTVWPNCTMSSL